MSDSSSNTPFRAKVMFDYQRIGEGEITIRAGDVVVVTDNSDKGWWVGYIEGNPDKEGFFPANYVENQSDTVDDTADGIIWRGLSRKLESAMEKIDSMQIELNDQKERIEELEGVPRMKKKVPPGMYSGGGKRKRKSKNSKRYRKRTKRRKSSKRRRRR